MRRFFEPDWDAVDRIIKDLRHVASYNLLVGLLVGTSIGGGAVLALFSFGVIK